MNKGDKVYLKAVGNNARGRKEVLIEEYEIKKIGRKYFDVGRQNEEREHTFIKFYIDGLRQVTDYSPTWKLYFSEQEIIDEAEMSQLVNEIRQFFDIYNINKLSLDQLRRVKSILSE